MTVISDPAEPIASVEALRRAVRGPVLSPGDDGYGAETAGFNLAARLRPELIVGATGTGDVAAAVRYAAAHGLRVAVRATGHGPAPDERGALLITTSRMNAVTVDPLRATARIAAGTRWADVVTVANEHGLAAPVGSSSAVGAVGYLLGGGLSPFGRAVGYAADSVERIELVTADGRLREVTADDPDLFWALRGARDGFGVVTAVDVRLVPATTLYGGGVFFPAESAAEVLHAWSRWAPKLPESAGTSVAVLRLPPDPALPPQLAGRTVVHLRYSHLGETAVAEELIAPLRAVAPVLLDTLGPLPIAALDAVHMDPVEPMPSVDGGSYLLELPDRGVDALITAVAPHRESPLIMTELRLLGGRLRTAQGAPDAVTGRAAQFCVNAVALAVSGPEQAAGLVADVARAMRPWSCAPSLNFAGRRTDQGYAQLWDQPERARLSAIRRSVDPTGMFARSAVAPTDLG